MGLPSTRVGHILDLVGLTRAEADRRVRGYSLGIDRDWASPMRSWATPQVLILDEPANGLDPAGIRWMRDTLRDYADRGATVLLSSHLLHEIEVVADDLVVHRQRLRGRPRHQGRLPCGCRHRSPRTASGPRLGQSR